MHYHDSAQFERIEGLPCSSEILLGRAGGLGARLEAALTELKTREERLRDSEGGLRSTFERAPVGIAHVDPEGQWMRVNRKLCNILGYAREELLRKTSQDITHPDDLEADLGYVRRMLSGETRSCSTVKRYVGKDGRGIWVCANASLVRGPSGEPEYFIAVIEHITERKQELFKLVGHRKEELLEFAFRDTPECPAFGATPGGFLGHGFQDQVPARPRRCRRGLEW